MNIQTELSPLLKSRTGQASHAIAALFFLNRNGHIKKASGYAYPAIHLSSLAL
ncbi:hypothetical protein [Bordetella avium]|uniref:hypothetical protein n=1 Tax=Bordetella avium TaxID=521 RepID=UPI0013B37CA3|nr:hypothetical protein [Bordetella avium]